MLCLLDVQLKLFAKLADFVPQVVNLCPGDTSNWRPGSRWTSGSWSSSLRCRGTIDRLAHAFEGPLQDGRLGLLRGHACVNPSQCRFYFLRSAERSERRVGHRCVAGNWNLGRSQHQRQNGRGRHRSAGRSPLRTAASAMPTATAAQQAPTSVLAVLMNHHALWRNRNFNRRQNT
jgi:hypothetical protein